MFQTPNEFVTHIQVLTHNNNNSTAYGRPRTYIILWDYLSTSCIFIINNITNAIYQTPTLLPATPLAINY